MQLPYNSGEIPKYWLIGRFQECLQQLMFQLPLSYSSHRIAQSQLNVSPLNLNLREQFKRSSDRLLRHNPSFFCRGNLRTRFEFHDLCEMAANSCDASLFRKLKLIEIIMTVEDTHITFFSLSLSFNFQMGEMKEEKDSKFCKKNTPAGPMETKTTSFKAWVER